MDNMLKIRTDLLLFDHLNPRLVEFAIDTNTSEDFILNILWNNMAVDEIVQSIISNGFFQNEALLIVEEEGKNIVVEGNRRLAAVKAILNPEKVKGMAKYADQISEEIKSQVFELPVIKRDTRKASWGYIGFKHVNGPAKWGSYAKAQYIATVHDEFGISLPEISKQIGDNNQTVLKLYQGLMVIKQAEARTDFKRDDIPSKRLYFSHLYTGLQTQGFQKYLGLGTTPKETTSPVPEEKLENLERVMFWLFGSKKKNIDPIIESQNPDLGNLANVLKNDLATMTLEARNDLDEAYEVSLGASKVFVRCILDAKSDLQKAYANVAGYDGEEDLLKTAGTIFKLAENLYQTMKSIMDKKNNSEEILTEDD